MSLRFDIDVAPSGYAWWYIDALSDDGANGITIIAFVGSVFSPYYAFARRRGAVDPRNHCAFNIVLYGSERRWSMTERGASKLRALWNELRVGPSVLTWDGEALVAEFDEVTMPLPSPLRGTVRVMPSALTEHRIALDASGRHHWSPLAPCARIDVKLHKPQLRWQGHAYIDANQGEAPLEEAFAGWHWSRCCLPDGSATMFYDVERRDATRQSVALHIDTEGTPRFFDPPPLVRLTSSLWGIARATHSEAGAQPRVIKTLVDAPFYARSLVSARLRGRPVTAVHESLSLERFRRPWVQCMLPFRIPRRAR